MATSKPKSKKIKDYELVSIVGKGGMGEVYLAKHPTLKRYIILKKLSIRDRESQERFLKEAKVMLEFRHENIVQIYDHFKEGSATFIAMEYVKGKALNEIIEENGKIPVELALFILYQLALGLFHAHSKKVIHRDIKPHNVLISTDGDVKLTDFGIAKTSDEKPSMEITSPGTVIGTPAYMSPEQFSDSKSITYQSDIYSLGVVFYEMLTGERPFKNEFSPEVLSAIMKGKFTPATKIVKSLPKIVKTILRKTFNPKVKRRFKNLFSLIKILRKHFKKYNTFEIKDSIKRLLRVDKKIMQSPFYRNFRKRQARALVFSVIFLSLIAILAFSSLFYFTNRYYEWIASDKYGKVVVEFGTANLDINNILVGIDGKYERAVFNKKYKLIQIKKNKDKFDLSNYKIDSYIDKNFSKVYYLEKGEHEFSVVSGSYKNTKRDIVQPIVLQKKYKSSYIAQKIFIPIYELTPKDVIVYFRFWDSIYNTMLFGFDYYPDKSIYSYNYDENSPYIFNNYSYVKLKDYIMVKKRYNLIPFYSNNKYYFMVADYKYYKFNYDLKKFNVKFALDDRTVIIHTPLNPQPCVIKIRSNVKEVPFIINNDNDGLVYRNNEYVYQNFNNIIFKKINNNLYYTEIFLPPGQVQIKITKKGKTVQKWLNSGDELSLDISRKDGKYIY